MTYAEEIQKHVEALKARINKPDHNLIQEASIKQSLGYGVYFFSSSDEWKYVFSFRKLGTNPSWATGRYAGFSTLKNAIEHFKANCPEVEKFRLEEIQENCPKVRDLVKGKYRRSNLKWTSAEKEEDFKLPMNAGWLNWI